MFKKMKTMAALVLAAVLMMCLLTGCGSKTLKLEPFDMPWGTTQEEADGALKCVYRTNEREPNKIYVMNGDNDNALEAFGTTPSVIIYDFNLVKGEDTTRRLSGVSLSLGQEQGIAFFRAQAPQGKLLSGGKPGGRAAHGAAGG